MRIPLNVKCRHCSREFQSLPAGPRATYCYRPECRHAMKLDWSRRYRQRIREGYIPKEQLGRREVVTLVSQPEPKPFSWWVAQADAITETCAKCEGAMRGAYVPPTPATLGECAVVAHCGMCGAERMVVAGRGGVPYDEQGPGQLRGPREVARRMNTSRRVGA